MEEATLTKELATDGSGAKVTTVATSPHATVAAPAEPSSAPRYTKKRVAVKGKEMACVDTGEGDPIVFLHGNPTSSYLWRNVMPHCEGLGRLVAPDLIGMGDSDKLDDSGPGRYALAEQCAYLDALFDALALRERVTLIVHSWGAVLGAHWASCHASAVKGVVLMECAFTPFASDTMPAPLKAFVEAIRSEAGEAMILEKNVMIEGAITSGTIRALSDAELDHYRKPFLEPGESRRPMLDFARAIPIDNEPEESVRMLEGAGAWLAGTDTPKLLLLGDPGSSMTPEERDRIRAWPNVTEETVKGKHMLPEDSPDAIGAAIAAWYKTL